MPWFPAVNRSDMQADEMRSVEIEGRDILIVRKSDEFFAIGNVCTHSWGLLDQGELFDFEVKCPLHRGRFDLRNGAATEWPATVAVPSYATMIDANGIVHVQIDDERGEA
jgi:naphthalene 1,2-dioxygenase system ferredoxin subunit